jgi:hypothetical protein
MLVFHASRPTSIFMATDSECTLRSPNGVTATLLECCYATMELGDAAPVRAFASHPRNSLDI